MRVSYTPEQKARAVEVYNETKSYAKTIRILGYPPQYRTARCRQRDNELRPRRPGLATNTFRGNKKRLPCGSLVPRMASAHALTRWQPTS